MGQHEIKCPECNNWTPGDRSHCVHCGNLVDAQLIDQRERAAREDKRRRSKAASETAFEKRLKKMRYSTNPFTRFLYQVLNVIWMIYMALLAFVIWFTTIFSG